MKIIDIRPARATRALVSAGWPRDQAVFFAAALETMPSSLAAFAHCRRAFRPLGISAMATRTWLEEMGYLEVEHCAHCDRAIRSRACRVILKSRSYCNACCCADAVEAAS